MDCSDWPTTTAFGVANIGELTHRLEALDTARLIYFTDVFIYLPERQFRTSLLCSFVGTGI